MSRVTTRPNTKTSTAKSTGGEFIKSNLFTFFATLSGVVVGVLASLAMVAPALKSEVASATTRGLNASLASDTQPSSCSVNSGTSSGGSNATTKATAQTVSATMPEAGGKGGDTTPGGNSGWMHDMTSGVWQQNTSSIGGNNQSTKNTITSTNTYKSTVKNDNHVTVTNNNAQTAKSGDASTQYNDAGNASSNSGEATNHSDSSSSVTINN